MSEQTEREAILREIAKKRVVYRLAGMDALPVHPNLTYRSTSGAELPMAIYYPTSQPGKRVPIVIVPFAYPDPEARVRMYGPVTSWAQLLGASGLAAVIYGAEAPDEDVHAVLRLLRRGCDERETKRLDLRLEPSPYCTVGGAWCPKRSPPSDPRRATEAMLREPQRAADKRGNVRSRSASERTPRCSRW